MGLVKARLVASDEAVSIQATLPESIINSLPELEPLNKIQAVIYALDVSEMLQGHDTLVTHLN